ncbi:geranylgeranyl diphosphate synthase, type III [Acrasis kona]|uniref:Geranylgeranyl diphosphate synthase, type III n=1 Tax=Acrasis kona TaxID=1008807 RepID=A0AAW2YTA0_9EUKA
MKQTNTDEPQSPDSKAVLDPFLYLIKNSEGKGIRSSLIEAFNHWLEISDQNIQLVKNITERLHSASLMIDDVEDNSKLRRGIPCTHLMYGVPATINSANYIYFEALKDTQKLENSRATTVFVDELLNLHKGQALDIDWRDNFKCPTESEYIEMVKNKTGGLFRLSVGIMQSVSANTIDYTGVVNEMAVLFQILDDYLNLQSSKYHANKSFCEDLTEGKFSFPIIHSINQLPNDRRLVNIIKQKTQDEMLKKYAVQIMKETKSFEYSIKRLRECESRLYSEIERLGGNEKLVAIVHALMKQINVESTSFDSL